jgi:hypothetical protein
MDWLTKLFGLGGDIANHQAGTPGLARDLRYSPRNAWDREMQDFLGPLAAEDFAREARMTRDVGGMIAAAGTPAYAALKQIPAGREMLDEQFGTGKAYPSTSGVDQTLRAYMGLFGLR